MDEPGVTTTTERTPEAPPDFDAAFPDDGLDSPESQTTPDPSSGGDAPTSGDSPSSPSSGQTPPSSGATPASGSEPSPKPGTAAPPASGAKPAEGDQDFTPPQVAKPTDLRKWAERMGSRAKTAETELKTLRDRVKSLETSRAGAKPGPDTAALAEQLAAANKRIEKYENELRLTRYERSEEFEQKYQVPYRDALKRAYAEVKELIAFEPNPDDPENPKERMGTQADLDELIGLPTGQAIRRAKQVFGDAAMQVINHRQRIKELSENAWKAVDEYKTKGSEQEKQTRAQEQAREEAKARMFAIASEAYVKRNPDAFSPKDGDTEGNDLLTKGEEFAKAVFSGEDGLTPQQVVMRDARAFHWLRAYPRLARDVKKLRAELTAAQKTIEEIRASGPGKTSGSGSETGGASGPKNWEADFDERVPA